MENGEKCPVCGNGKYVYISIDGRFSPTFCAERNGSVDVVACTNCGVIRLTQETLKFRKIKSI